MNPELDRLLSPDEVAERLSIKVRTAREWCRTGVLPAFKLGDRGLLRVRESDLAAFINGLERARAGGYPSNE
jgi:excisionase family DNA binding protein